MEPSPAFAQAIARFNARDFFACHETLEPLWLAATGDERTFLHAFIQLAVALHHHQHGNLKGARSVAQRALQKLNSLPSHPFSSLTDTFNECCAQMALNSELNYPQLTLSDERKS
jgi:predicted metal-dependent hydrolase